MILPIRCGNSNRADLQQISNSLLQQRGDAITTAQGSIIWIETQAWARALYSIWANNQKMVNQFDPHKMTDFIGRWATILGVSLLPTDTLQARQNRLAARFNIINKFPTTQAITDLLKGALGPTFLGLLNTTASTAYVQFPGGAPITGGVQNVVNGPWLSDIHELFIEVYHPTYMPDNQFYDNVNQVYNLLNSYVPAYDTFDWFWNGFCDDGYAGGPGNLATVSISVGSTTLTGTGTAWLTPIDTDGTENLVDGSIIEVLSDVGTWLRLEVETVNSNTSITLADPATATVTNQHYVIQGIFLDCDSLSFPYPPTCRNLDNAGFNNV
jgi:hypothetical protein